MRQSRLQSPESDHESGLEHLACGVCGAIGFSEQGQQCPIRTDGVTCLGVAILISETPDTGGGKHNIEDEPRPIP